MEALDGTVRAQEARLAAVKDTVNMHLQRIIDLTPAAVQNLQNAPANINAAKQVVETSLDTIQQITNTIDSATKSVTELGKSSGASYMNGKAQLNTLKKDEVQNKKLFELRKAQADSLKHKYAADNHSSYFGLWRPLADDTRFLLFLLSILLGVIAAVSAYFLVKSNASAFSFSSFFSSWGGAPSMARGVQGAPAQKQLNTNLIGGAASRRLFPKNP